MRRAITHHDVTLTIDQIDRIALAIADVLGQPGPIASSRGDVAEAGALLKEVVERQGRTKAQPLAQNWRNMPGGVTARPGALSFSRFGCRSELYFEHPDPATNLRRWRVLADRSVEFKARFGVGLIFDDLPRNKGCRIETRLHGVAVEQRDRWPDIQNWMEDTQMRLRAAVAAAGGVPS